MAKYFALIDNTETYLQKDIFTNQLEIYETQLDALKVKTNNTILIEVEVKRFEPEDNQC